MCVCVWNRGGGRKRTMDPKTKQNEKKNGIECKCDCGRADVKGRERERLCECVLKGSGKKDGSSKITKASPLHFYHSKR